MEIKEIINKFQNDEYSDAEDHLKQYILQKRDSFLNTRLGLETEETGEAPEIPDDEED